jgi:hypothetical protein
MIIFIYLSSNEFKIRTKEVLNINKRPIPPLSIRVLLRKKFNQFIDNCKNIKNVKTSQIGLPNKNLELRDKEEKEEINKPIKSIEIIKDKDGNEKKILVETNKEGEVRKIDLNELPEDKVKEIEEEVKELNKDEHKKP